HSLVGAVPRVPAQRSETHTKSWTKRVGTGALPLQNDDLSENETALLNKGGQERSKSPPNPQGCGGCEGDRDSTTSDIYYGY
ncbi:MAG TPA: hypothetical protein DD001_04125, partial [Microcoleaceae bacterium UBA10368]|nr:hypothetical protein [Microcoleaceae cyanobacterium UBA10368]